LGETIKNCDLMGLKHQNDGLKATIMVTVFDGV
jgi:hypothetical protein